MLHLGEPLAIGRTRTIYPHPERPGWLIKVENDLSYSDTGKLGTVWRKKLAKWCNLAGENQRELHIYQRFSGDLTGFIPAMELELIETDKGLGLVCQQVLNDDGSRSPSIADTLLKEGKLQHRSTQQLNELLSILQRKNLFFFDLNLDNFLIRTQKNREQIYFIDLKSYRKDKSLFSLTNFSNKLAQKKMKRRIKKLNIRLELGAKCLSNTNRPKTKN